MYRKQYAYDRCPKKKLNKSQNGTIIVFKFELKYGIGNLRKEASSRS